MNTAIAYTDNKTNTDINDQHINEPVAPYQQQRQSQQVLRSVEITLNRQIQRLDDAFALLGWHDLPDCLKTEIAVDVSLMIDELDGRYSSIDHNVAQRRRAVRYWIDCYQQGVCTRQTALEALQKADRAKSTRKRKRKLTESRTPTNS